MTMVNSAPQILTPRQERFAVAYVATGNKSEAYRRAGYSQRQSAESLHVAASRLSSLAKVSLRIVQIRGQLAADTGTNLLMVNNILNGAVQLALEQKRPGDLTRAAMALAKLNGLIVDKSADQSGHMELLNMLNDQSAEGVGTLAAE